MKDLKILIVDDEKPARERLRRYLEQEEGPIIVAEAEDAFEAMDQVKSFEPHIVFLDVLMPEMSGFEFLQNLSEPNFHIIFQTAHNEFAVNAFEVNAVDFLLKPFTRDRFRAALARCVRLLERENNLVRLSQFLVERKHYLKRFLVKVGERRRILDADEILYFSSEEHTTMLHTGSVSYAFDLALKTIVDQVDPNAFLQIHKKYIINLRKLRQLRQARPLAVELCDGTVLPVARGPRERVVRERIEAYCRG